jgi:zinc protease
MKMTLFIDPNSGWVNTPKGTQDLPGPAQQQIRSQLTHQLPVLLPQLAKTPGQVAYSGPGKLQVSTSSGEAMTLAVDEATGALQSLTYSEEGGTATENFSDWRDVGGLKLPFKTETVKGGKTSQTVTTSDLKINTNLKAEELGKRP